MTIPTGVAALTFEFARAVQTQLMPILERQEQLEELGARVLEEKEHGHYAYEIDELSNRILLDVIQKSGVHCRVFSEESGWINFGATPLYKLICDPFCNTALAMRSFRESAAAICMIDMEGHFLSCAIADLNVRRIFYADVTGVFVYFPKNDEWRTAHAAVSKVRTLNQAFIVVSALKQRRREWLVGRRLFTLASQMYNSDGAIFLARLSSGYIDAYLDPSIGQPLYEVPCLEMVKRAGGIVSDVNGNYFDLGQLFNHLEDEPKGRYRFVAAATPELHQELLDAIC